jgi:pimeloyl-ACP methyl ester carboxylesterase
MSIALTESGVRIAWDSFGSTAHPPIVLIQGLSAQMVGWRPGFCQSLAAKGFHVVRFDNRDVGESQRHPQGGYSLGDFADDTAALLDELGLATAHIAGQSMGGMIAQLLWQRHPNRVRSLGLIYTAATGLHYADKSGALERQNRPIPSDARGVRRLLRGRRIPVPLHRLSAGRCLAERIERRDMGSHLGRGGNPKTGRSLAERPGPRGNRTQHTSPDRHHCGRCRRTHPSLRCARTARAHCRVDAANLPRHGTRIAGSPLGRNRHAARSERAHR